MEKSDVFVLCPRHGTACDIDTCPRFLQNAEILSSSDGKRTASGFCLERGSRYITDVPAECILDRNDAATLQLEERDAHDEAKRIRKIKDLIQRNYLYIAALEDADKTNDSSVLFDIVIETLEKETKLLDIGKLSTPCASWAWQRVLPEILSFPDGKVHYYIEEDIANHPEAEECTLPNGEKVPVNFSVTPGPLDKKIMGVRQATETYLEKGLQTARLRNSSSKDTWTKALSCLRRATDAWTLPESRKLLDDMASNMIEAASLLAIDLSIPDTSTSMRDTATADAVAERLQPSFDEQRRSLANITRIVKSTGDGLRLFFGKLAKWFTPRKDVSREEVTTTIDKVHRYDCIARVPEPHRSQLIAVIDYTYEHPIVHEKDRKFGKDAISLSEAAQTVFNANIEKWKHVPGAWTDFNSFKTGCYQHRGTDHDPDHYATK